MKADVRFVQTEQEAYFSPVLLTQVHVYLFQTANIQIVQTLASNFWYAAVTGPSC